MTLDRLWLPLVDEYGIVVLREQQSPPAAAEED